MLLDTGEQGEESLYAWSNLLADTATVKCDKRDDGHSSECTSHQMLLIKRL